jgi:hypothetical protein
MMCAACSPWLALCLRSASRCAAVSTARYSVASKEVSSNVAGAGRRDGLPELTQKSIEFWEPRSKVLAPVRNEIRRENLANKCRTLLS